MSEERMAGLVQDALAAAGVNDEVLAAGQFNPRGQTGGLFAGGLAGNEAGGLLGEAAGAIGLGAGSLAGMHAAGARSGLPDKMLVGVTATTVYGFAAPTRHSQPTALVFQVPRASLTVQVHQRVNVRVLELIDEASGSRIELEGNRLPVTHSQDVIAALSGLGP
ncbi:MAG TPA: hypothetical protein VH089_19630 [Streptosporangiaceae bacterium]|nr:hypothetical protein [Streptosporangiaceae bacterium]